jgi:periplasmic divalent cation tolerance protein
VNVVPGMRSYYRWEGVIESATEFLLLIKSSRELFPMLRRKLEEHHSYSVPEVVALPIVDGAPNYLEWLHGNLIDPEKA